MIRYLEKESDFDTIIKEDKVLVDFYADWCGPCRAMGEVLEKMENINVLKINTDTFQDLSFKYGVMSIPTLILFEKGEEVKKMIGLQSKSDIEELFK